MKSIAPSWVARTAVSMLPWPEMTTTRVCRMMLLDLAQGFDAVDLRHPDVEQDQSRALRGDHGERGPSVVGLEHPESLVRKHPAYTGADLLLVIHDQDGLSHEPPLLLEIRR